MLRLAFDFIITWRETRTRPNAYLSGCGNICPCMLLPTILLAYRVVYAMSVP